ncbi:MAG: glycosyltransferase family 4 protein [Mangrovicoccus sp.]|nr:glycosyltransferase family 4 protein [Mangrovicoccus sp.]
MITNSATFVVPGDPETRTGGYIYEKQVLLHLRRLGRPVRLLRIAAGFPDPTPQEIRNTAAILAGCDANIPLILDGFLVGAMPAEHFAQIRAPFVAMIHHPLALETGLSAQRAAWLKATETRNLVRAAQVVVPSPRTKQDLISHYGVPGEKITIALPGVPRPAGPQRPQDPPLILSVGTLVPRKGHDVLIKALAQITDLPWHVAIAGARRDAATATALEAQVAQSGLGGRIRFLGEVTEARLSELYRQARIFALATRLEGYGMVFAEALSHGLPIVSCNNTAIPDTVPADAGALVPTDDVAAFAAALRQLLTDHVAYDAAQRAAHQAGALLPQWAQTAGHMAAALDRATAAVAAR